MCSASNGQKTGSAQIIQLTWFQTVNCHVLTPVYMKHLVGYRTSGVLEANYIEGIALVLLIIHKMGQFKGNEFHFGLSRMISRIVH